MTKLISFALGAGLAVASIGLAHADSSVAGAWKYTVGAHGTPCTLTLTADASGASGTIDSGQDCSGGFDKVAAWKTVGNDIELMSGTGNLVASLKPTGNSYVGTRFADGRKVTLSR